MAPQLTTLGLGGDKMAEDIEITALHSFYRSLSELVGTEAMLEVYRHYRGIQVSIPVHLYDRNLAAQRVLTEFTGTNQQALARKYGYSEKWVRVVLHRAAQQKGKELK